MGLFTGKKLLIFGFVIVLLAVIPITVYFLQKQQELKSSAAPATTLSIEPAETSVATGQTVTLNVMLDPGGTNLVASTTLDITYDNTKLATDGAGLSAVPEIAGQPGLNTVVENSIYTAKGNIGHITIVLSVGTDFTKTVKTKTRIATVMFKALAPTAQTEVGFDRTRTLVTAFDVDSNVLANSIPAKITITGGTDLSPTPIPTSGPTGPAGQNQSPVCTLLSLDRSTSGAAPFSVTFTGTGRDTDGTISKATFNFGDGPTQDVAQAGGIGTGSVSVQTSHTYNNPGSFTASVVFTDNNNAVSAPVAECQKTITVTTATGATVAPTTGNPTITPVNPTPTLAAQLTPLPKPGAGDKIMGIAGAGIILSILGSLIFLAL